MTTCKEAIGIVKYQAGLCSDGVLFLELLDESRAPYCILNPWPLHVRLEKYDVWPSTRRYQCRVTKFVGRHPPYQMEEFLKKLLSGDL